MSDGKMRNKVMWAIRDNHDLSANEKALLWAVESRGRSFGSWETVAADAGMSKNRFYLWRKRLREKGYLVVTERPGRTTEYRVSEESLMQGTPRTGDRSFPESGNGGSADRVIEEDLQEDSQEDLLLTNPGDLHGVNFAKPSQLSADAVTVDWDAWAEDMSTDVWFAARWSMDMKRLYRDPLVENIT